MTPISLRLSGFVGIADGLGKQEIFLDFESLPFGLIAIVGPNGKGKTTIIDNMHPYRIMPSRTDKFSVHSFSYFDHLVPGKGAKTFVWKQPDGRLFKSELVLTVKSKKSDCYLFEFISDSWVPYRSSDGLIISDGKTDSYDRSVESLLGSPELFFTSRFLAQGRRALSTYGNTDIKALLSEMLGIESMKLLSKRASEVSEMLTRELTSRQEEIVRMRTVQEERKTKSSLLDAVPANLVILRSDKTATTIRHEQAVLQLQRLEQSLVEDEKNLLRIKDLRVQLADAMDKRGKATVRHEEDARKRKITIFDLENQVVTYESQLGIKDSVVNAIAQMAALQKRLDADEKALVGISAKWDAAQAMSLKRSKLEGQLVLCKTEGESSRAVLNNLSTQASLSQSVPCHSMAINATCPLLDNARKAGQVALEKEISFKDLVVKYKGIKNDLDGVTLQLPDLDELKVLLDLAKKQLETLRKEQFAVAQLAAKKEQVEFAEQSVLKSKKLLDDVQAQFITSTETYAAENGHFGQIIVRIEEELASLSSLDRSREIANARLQVESLKTSLASIEGKLEAEIRNHSRLTAEVAQLDKQLQSEPFLQHCVGTLSSEVAVWKQLSVGLGNSGLIALCIDDAGPVLSDLVNQLLICYDTQYSIEIKTQVDMANGNVKEGFEIVVHDSQAVTPKKLEFMSGGQKVWINDCLCRGIALYLGQNAGNTCLTLFSDETDGPLDLARKRQFMQMKRKVLQISQCEREYFISHTPECVDLADAVIDLDIVTL